MVSVRIHIAVPNLFGSITCCCGCLMYRPTTTFQSQLESAVWIPYVLHLICLIPWTLYIVYWWCEYSFFILALIWRCNLCKESVAELWKTTEKSMFFSCLMFYLWVVFQWINSCFGLYCRRGRCRWTRKSSGEFREA